MRFKTQVLAVLFLAGAGSAPAWADISPPDSCTAPGQPCANAGSPPNQPGTCTPSTCVRTVPAADGGFATMSYPCNLCKKDGGAGGAGGAGGGAGNSGTGGTAASGGSSGSGGSPRDGATTDGPSTSSSSGCAVTPVSGGSTRDLVLTSLLGLFAMLVARRPRSHSRRR